MKTDGRFGGYGGVFVPQILLPALEELEEAFYRAQDDEEFQTELAALLRDYAGRPTPLYRCRRLCADTGSVIYLKREDLVHGGAHKTNQVLAQIDLWKGDHEIGVYRLDKRLDEEVARLHLAKLGAKMTKLTPEQAEYIGVPVEGPFKPEHYRY